MGGDLSQKKIGGQVRTDDAIHQTPDGASRIERQSKADDHQKEPQGCGLGV